MGSIKDERGVDLSFWKRPLIAGGATAGIYLFCWVLLYIANSFWWLIISSPGGLPLGILMGKRVFANPLVGDLVVLLLNLFIFFMVGFAVALLTRTRQALTVLILLVCAALIFFSFMQSVALIQAAPTTTPAPDFP